MNHTSLVFSSKRVTDSLLISEKVLFTKSSSSTGRMTTQKELLKVWTMSIRPTSPTTFWIPNQITEEYHSCLIGTMRWWSTCEEFQETCIGLLSDWFSFNYCCSCGARSDFYLFGFWLSTCNWLLSCLFTTSGWYRTFMMHSNLHWFLTWSFLTRHLSTKDLTMISSTRTTPITG